MPKSIIRRLDNFGRITLPHDMRRAMHLEESDPVEIEYDKKKITISPYIMLNEIEGFILPCLKALKKTGDNHYVFTAQTEICLSYLKGAERGVSLSEELVHVLRKRKDHVFEDFSISLTSCSQYSVTAVFPIIASGDLHGGVVIVTNDNKKPTEDQLVKAKLLRDIIAQEIEGKGYV